MAVTTHLQLQKINSSDYVSPEPINANMDKLDKLGVDYIIEQGKSGDWWYRKWKSGRAECGVDNKSFGPANVKSWGNIFSTYEGFKFGAYPFAFKTAPFVTVTRSPSGAQGAYFGIVTGEVSYPTTQAPPVDLWRSDEANFSNVVLSIYVTGFYK